MFGYEVNILTKVHIVQWQSDHLWSCHVQRMDSAFCAGPLLVPFAGTYRICNTRQSRWIWFSTQLCEIGTSIFSIFYFIILIEGQLSIILGHISVNQWIYVRNTVQTIKLHMFLQPNFVLETVVPLLLCLGIQYKDIWEQFWVQNCFTLLRCFFLVPLYFLFPVRANELGGEKQGG